MSNFPLYDLLQKQIQTQSITPLSKSDKSSMIDYINHGMNNQGHKHLFTLIRRHQLIIQNDEKFANPYQSEKTNVSSNQSECTYEFSLNKLPLSLQLMIKQFCEWHSTRSSDLETLNENVIDISI